MPESKPGDATVPEVISPRGKIIRSNAVSIGVVSYCSYVEATDAHITACDDDSFLSDPSIIVESAAIAELRGTIVNEPKIETDAWFKRGCVMTDKLKLWQVPINEERLTAVTSFLHARSLIRRVVSDAHATTNLEEEAFDAAHAAEISSAKLSVNYAHDIMYPESLRQRSVLIAMSSDGYHPIAVDKIKQAIVADAQTYNRVLPGHGIGLTRRQSRQRDIAAAAIVLQRRFVDPTDRLSRAALKLLV